MLFSPRSRALNAVLGLFFAGSQVEHYVREIERATGEPIGSIQRQLAALEREGVLKSRRQGPLKYFALNEGYRYLPELRSVVSREQRRVELEKNLKKILMILKKRYRPEKVVVFGSLAGGRVSPDSDLDLLIVKKDAPPRYWDRVREIAPFLAGCSVGVDYVIWTPSEIEKSAGANLFLNEEILRKGRVVYERAA